LQAQGLGRKETSPFTPQLGQAGWHATGLADILQFVILNYKPLADSPAEAGLSADSSNPKTRVFGWTPTSSQLLKTPDFRSSIWKNQNNVDLRLDNR